VYDLSPDTLEIPKSKSQNSDKLKNSNSKFQLIEILSLFFDLFLNFEF